MIINREPCTSRYHPCIFVGVVFEAVAVNLGQKIKSESFVQALGVLGVDRHWGKLVKGKEASCVTERKKKRRRHHERVWKR